MSKSVLQFENVSFFYPNDKEPIIGELDFSVDDGELVSIIGPSGSGKTTIFRLITGLENPTLGAIRINGTTPLNRLGLIGYMPQQDLLLPWRTILENIMLPLEIKGLHKKSMKKDALILLKQFGLGGYEHRFPANLSGGMKQRVSFLRTILTGSNILLLDEPFSALDAITRLSMQEWLIEQWQRLKKTILFITHDVDEALLLSDRIFVLTQKPTGKLQEITVPLSRPRSVRDLGNEEMINIKEKLIEQLRMKVSP